MIVGDIRWGLWGRTVGPYGGAVRGGVRILTSLNEILNFAANNKIINGSSMFIGVILIIVGMCGCLGSLYRTRTLTARIREIFVVKRLFILFWTPHDLLSRLKSNLNCAIRLQSKVWFLRPFSLTFLG